MQEELRLYSFVNFYLSSIQQGIQTGHMSDEMTVKYVWEQGVTPESNMYIDWIKDHKTYIILNGGDSVAMYAEMLQFLAICDKLNLPTGIFNEPGCNNMVTCYGAIIPARYFNAKKNYCPIDSGGFVEDGYQTIIDEEEVVYRYSSIEYEFITFLKSKSLAR